MHLRVGGAGEHTVVLEGGWLQWSPFWTRVQEALASRYCTVAPDRLGLGGSTGGALPRSTYQIVDELQEALEKLGVGSSVIAVGAGFGAVHARVLAFRDGAVSGLLLVDPLVEVLARSKPFAAYRDRLDGQLQKAWGPMKAWLGDWPGGMRGLPKDAARDLRTGLSKERCYAMRAELGALEESIQQLSTLGAPSVPCGVLSRPGSEFAFALSGGGEDAAIVMQRKLSEQSPGGFHQVVEARRFLPIDAPEHVVDAVDRLTAHARGEGPSTSPGTPAQSEGSHGP